VSRIPTLIETIRVRHGRAPLWYLHLRRLVESCRALGVPFPRAFEVPAGHERVHRLAVGPEGLRVSERMVGSTEPVALVTAATVHRAYPHKVTVRDAFDRAAEEARAAAADDALLLTAGGEVAECTRWSLLWWEGDRLVAPPLALGVLRGVARRRLEEMTGPLLERVLPRAGLEGRSLVLANAVRGLVPVRALDGRPVPPHPATPALQERFWP
jgi:branched-subunit amino acid aminotransferase/4-amino-4-deoxychorismate lyase